MNTYVYIYMYIYVYIHIYIYPREAIGGRSARPTERRDGQPRRVSLRGGVNPQPQTLNPNPETSNPQP